MIGIKLDGENEFLDTLKNTAIEITISNPLLGDNEDKLSPGSYTMPFSLPGGNSSPKNAALLKNPDVIENNAAYQIQRAALFFDQVLFKSGKLKARTSVNDVISANFTFGLNSLSPKLKTARLREIFNNEIVISSDPIGKEIFVKKSDEVTDATLKINGLEYHDDTTPGLNARINDYFADNMEPDAGFWLPFSNLIEAGDTPLGLSPDYLRIRMAQHQTIDDVITLVYSTDPHIEFNIKIEEEFIDEFRVEVGDLTDYYADFKTFSDSRVKFPVMFNANLHDGKVTKESEIINGVDADGLVVNDPNAQYDPRSQHYRNQNKNSLQPFVHLKYVLDTIATELGFEYEGDFYEETDLANMLIDNSQTLDLPMSLINDWMFCFWRRSFNLNELLPDITVVDFFKALKSRYNLGVYVNETNGKVRLVKREGIALSTGYHDITSLSSPIGGTEDLRLSGLKLFQPKEKSDDFSEDETLIIGDEPEVSYTINCGRLFRTKGAVFNDGDVEGPYTSRKNGDEFGFRIFHYLGLVDNGTYSYPSAAISGPTINETLSDVPTNLYTRFWKYWLLFTQNQRSIKLNVTYPFRLLRFYDFEKKRRFDRSDFLVKSIQLRITNQRIEVSEVELRTMQ